MVGHVLWHGTQVEALDLLQSLNRNCSCVFTADGTRLSTCAPHQMLATDQRAIDGLLFARRIAGRLRIEEFSPTQTPTPTPGSDVAPSRGAAALG